MLFLLEEELCDVNLCTLHCELRNTEQLLCSLGMFAYEYGSLKNCNAVLAEYGPDSMKGRDRIVVKTKPGQESGIERHIIQVLSFSGIQSYIRLMQTAIVTVTFSTKDSNRVNKRTSLTIKFKNVFFPLPLFPWPSANTKPM